MLPPDTNPGFSRSHRSGAACGCVSSAPRRIDAAGRGAAAATGSAVPVMSHTRPGSRTPAARHAAMLVAGAHHHRDVRSGARGLGRPPGRRVPATDAGGADRAQRSGRSADRVHQVGRPVARVRGPRAASWRRSRGRCTARRSSRCDGICDRHQVPVGRGLRRSPAPAPRSQAILGPPCEASMLTPVRAWTSRGVESSRQLGGLRCGPPVHPDDARPDGSSRRHPRARCRRPGRRCRWRRSVTRPTCRHDGADDQSQGTLPVGAGPAPPSRVAGAPTG